MTGEHALFPLLNYIILARVRSADCHSRAVSTSHDLTQSRSKPCSASSSYFVYGTFLPYTDVVVVVVVVVAAVAERALAALLDMH